MPAKEDDVPEFTSRDPRRLAWRSLVVPTETRERRRGMRGQRERRTKARCEFEMRGRPDGTGGTVYSFEGYAAAFENPFEMFDWWGDPYLETLGSGSCTRTLANGCDTQFLIGHNEALIPLARTRSGTMTLSADSTGLLVRAPSLDGDNFLVRAVASAMDRKDMDEMSIGFIATQQSWSPDFMERRITEINLDRGDVSIVCWAANPAAAGASMIAMPGSESAARRPGPGNERRTPTEPYSAHPNEDAECPQCHSMNDRDAAYCDQCGTAIQPTGQSAVDEDETQRCSCGNWNAADAKFCDQCGQNISSDLDADNGGRGNGSTTADSSGWWDWRRPQRRAAAAADAEPDFSAKPAQDTSAHGDNSPTCPNPECAAPNAEDAAYCDQCGECLYDEGGLIQDGQQDDVVNDTSGMIEEEDMTLARARVRVLQLRQDPTCP